MEEIWKPVHGCPEYLINKKGQIKDLKKNRLVSITGTKSPYIRTLLRDSRGGHVSNSLHRLLAIAFIPNPENKPMINHIDGNKRNNDLSNLEWCTAGENVRHAYSTGLNKGALKEKVLVRVQTVLNDETIEYLTK